MTSPPPGKNELTAALAAIDRIAVLVADENDTVSESADRSLALTFCLVNPGSQLKQFVRKARLSFDAEPLTPPIKMRDKLAYGPLPRLRTDVVWKTCVYDIPQLGPIVAELAAAV